MSDEMDHTPVESYAGRGMDLWRGRVRPHFSNACPCLSCADARKYLNRPALVPPMLPVAQREERAT